MSRIGTNRERGFTLIELLVGMSILIVVAVIGGDLIFNVIRSYNKANILAEIEQNGNHTMSIMEQQIRNAESISTGGFPSSISITTYEEDSINFASTPPSGTGPGCTNGTVVRNGVSITSDDEVSGVNISSLSFSSNPEGTLITVSMTLGQACNAPTRREFRVDPLTLTTTVVLRSSYTE